jgi:glycosyltransferase involved in cell wall biosynthesis
MTKLLIFDTTLSGHHLEYLHHLYSMAVNMCIPCVFCVPNYFEEKVKLLKWDITEHPRIIFDYLSSDEINTRGNFVGKSKVKSALLRKKVHKYKPTDIFIVSLMDFLPLLPLFIHSPINVSGIIYQIYLYRWHKSTLLQKVMDITKFVVFSKCNVFKNVFILNDVSSTEKLNRLYHTEKFVYLSDPCLPITIEKPINRNDLNISNDCKVFLHFGSMGERKGTINILRAIQMLDTDHSSNSCFIFAGKLSDEIKIPFEKLHLELESKTKIIVFDEFCDYSFLGSLCTLSDYILIPYKRTGASSGVIAYGAQFGVPVIGPASGLLGKLIRKFKLGYALQDVSPEGIADFIMRKHEKYSVSNRYLEDHKVSAFTSVIESALLKAE